MEEKIEIDKAHYCAGDYYQNVVTVQGKEDLCVRFIDMNKPCIKDLCGNYHRKWPTPEQYKAEYGEEWPDDWAVYVAVDSGQYRGREFNTWKATSYKEGRDMPPCFINSVNIVCASTLWGKPPDDWRPE
jgi:hypothetical protein